MVYIRKRRSESYECPAENMLGEAKSFHGNFERVLPLLRIAGSIWLKPEPQGLIGSPVELQHQWNAPFYLNSHTKVRVLVGRVWMKRFGQTCVKLRDFNPPVFETFLREESSDV